MLKSKILNLFNENLAGEMFKYDEIVSYLDEAIDDINTSLDSNFPPISEFTPSGFPGYKEELYTNPDGTINTTAQQAVYNNYDVIPDRYIRTVLIPGAVFKWFTVDEEGAQTAVIFQQKFITNLFYMTRDYIDQVPAEFDNSANTGAVTEPFYEAKFRTATDTFGMF